MEHFRHFLLQRSVRSSRLFPSYLKSCPLSEFQFFASFTSTTTENSPQDIYRSIIEHLDKGVAPQKTLLPSLVSSCATSDDINKVLSAMRKIRTENAVKRDNLKEFSEELAIEYVRACIRVGSPERGLIALQGAQYGLVPNLSTAHLLLGHAKETKNVSLVKLTLNSLKLSKLVSPSKKLIQLAVETFHEAGRAKDLVHFAKGIRSSGIFLPEAAMTTALQSCVDQGRWKDGLFLLEGTPGPTTVAAVTAISKLHILASDVEAAEAAIVHYRDFGGADWETAVSSVVEEDWISNLPVEKNGTVKGVTKEELMTFVSQLKDNLGK